MSSAHVRSDVFLREKLARHQNNRPATILEAHFSQPSINSFALAHARSILPTAASLFEFTPRFDGCGAPIKTTPFGSSTCSIPSQVTFPKANTALSFGIILVSRSVSSSQKRRGFVFALKDP